MDDECVKDGQTESSQSAPVKWVQEQGILLTERGHFCKKELDW